MLILWFCVATPLHAQSTADLLQEPEAWHQYGSDNLHLVTDLPVAKAQRLNQALQAFAQVVQEYLPQVEHHNIGAVRMLVFKKRHTLQALVRKSHFAAFAQPGLSETLLVVAPSGRRATLYENAFHEYTHYLLRTHARAYPLWYEEGIASVLGASKLRWLDEHVEIRVGLPPAHESALQPEVMSPLALRSTVEGLTHSDWGIAEMPIHYQRSAWLAHYFTFRKHKDAAVQQARLRGYWERRDVDLFVALDSTPQALLRSLRSHGRRTHRAKVHAIEIMEPPEPTPITASNVLALHARVASSLNPPKAVELYAHLLQISPDQDRWRSELANVQLTSDPQLAATTLSQAHDDNAPSILIGKASLRMHDCPLDPTLSCRSEWQAAGALLRLALEQDPDRFDGIFQLGLVELYAGKPGAALNYLRLAHQRIPWSARVNFHLGECYRLLGYSMARTHLVRARDWAHSDLTLVLAEAALDLMGPEQEKQ